MTYVFTDDLASLQHNIEQLGWEYRVQKVGVEKGGKSVEFTHIYLMLDYIVELSVYPFSEIRVRGKSSITGKSIERLSVAKVRALVASGD